MPRLLKDLVINRVAAVDKGAGEGVRVVLMKRDAATGKAAALIEVTKALKQAIAKDGAIDFDGAEMRQEMGEETRELMCCLRDAVCALDLSLSSILYDDDVADKETAMTESLQQFKDYLGGLGLGEDMGEALADVAKGKANMTGTTQTPLEKQIAEAVAKGIAAAVTPLTAKVDGLTYENAVLKMSPLAKAHHDSLPTEDARKAFAAKDKKAQDDEADDTKKRANELPAPLQKALEPILKTNEALVKQNAEFAATIKSLTDKDAVASFSKRAVDLGLHASHGPIMMKAYQGDVEAIAQHEQALKALTAQARAGGDLPGGLFGELGKGAGDGGGGARTANDELMAKAEEVRKAEPKLSIHQAYTKVYTDPANAELAKRHKNEEMAKRHRAA